MNNVIDINKYILSDDIRNYFKRCETSLTLQDIVTIIHYSNSVSYNQKIKDYKKVIEEYEKEKGLIEHSKDNDDAINYMREYIKLSTISKDEFYDNSNAIYEFRSFYEDEIPYDDEGRYTSVDECIEACKRLDIGSNITRLSIYKSQLNKHIPSSRAIFNENYELVELERFKRLDLSDYNISSTFSDNLPFNQGDIVIDKSNKDELNKPLLIIEEYSKGNKYNLWPSLARINDSGELEALGTRSFVTNYELYKEDKNTNEYKLLSLISKFLKGRISLECFIDHIGHYYDLSRIEVKNKNFHPNYPFESEIERMKPPVWVRAEEDN